MIVSAEGAFVLLATAFDVHVTGGLAEVELTQSYRSPFQVPVDATWLFPLPPDANVRAMSMKCGGREVHADIVSRAEARTMWEGAAEAGQTSALLEQHRPDLFDVSVSAVCPRETVVVDLTYVAPVEREDGAYQIHFPTTMGPRWSPGHIPQPGLTKAPIRSVSLALSIDEGLPVEALWSDTHPFTVLDEDGNGAHLVLADGQVTADSDIVMSWTLAGEDPRLSALAIPPRDGEAGYLSVLLEPRILEDLGSAEPRELLFLLDRSGSMQGLPWDVAKAVVGEALAHLRPGDTFNLVPFASSTEPVFQVSQRPTDATLAIAHDWLSSAQAGGGTELVEALHRALTERADPSRQRLVLLVTDGLVGTDLDSISTVETFLGSSRVFTLGVGSSPNHYLLDHLAHAGRGVADFHPLEADVADTVERFTGRIAHPVARDLTIDWGGLTVSDMFPARLPDLFAGQPVRVFARWQGDPTDVIVKLHGTTSRAPFSVSRALALATAESHPALPAVWARGKLDDLEHQLRDTPEVLKTEATPVAVAHHLVGRWTSLVAVDDAPSPCGPGHMRVDVPAMIPRGMRAPDIDAILPPRPPVRREPSPSFGGGGLGGRGSGIGGGGVSLGGGQFGTHGEGGIATVGGDPVIFGALDRDLIDEVIKRYLHEIRYCYQRELTKHPSLAGKVTIKFTIADDGTVSAAATKTTTLHDPAVETCIVGRFVRMSFPPPNGGIVIVTYPFVFAPR